jgi:hypothetical protein
LCKRVLLKSWRLNVKIAVVALLCAVVALAACRREEAKPLKLGGPAVEQAVR